MINLLNYLLISNIFTGGFFLYTAFFQFYLGYIFMIFFIVFCLFLGKFYINKGFVLVLISVSLLSILNVGLGNNSFFSFLKQLIGFTLNGVTYYSLIRFNKNNLDKLIRVYLKIALIIAIIGIFQEVSFLTGFTYGYDYTYFIPGFRSGGFLLGMLRVSSILQEPAHFGTAMAPAMFISLLNIINKKNYFISRKAGFLIIISTLLSFSLVTYVGIVIALLLIMLNYQRARIIFAAAIILFALAFFSYRYLPLIKLRVDDTLAVISGKMPFDKANASTLSFCSNGYIAYKSFKNNPLFGSGVGSYPILYDRYITQVIDPAKILIGLNKEDASALFFRLISETGLLGILLFFYFCVRFYVSRKRDGHFWIISNSILCLFILNLLRQGNYFYNGFIFFVWMYYFAYKVRNGPQFLTKHVEFNHP